MLFLLVTLSSVFMTFSLELCDKQTPCRCVAHNNSVIDLSSVGQPDNPRFYEVQFENYPGLYSYNPCYPFHSQDQPVQVPEHKSRCFEAAICIRIPGKPDSGLPEEYMIGSQSSAVFRATNEDVKYIEYSVPEPKSIVRVQLICDDTLKGHEFKIVNSTNEYTVFNLTSKCACFDACSSETPVPVETPSGLSVGSKLLIAFFTILLAYLLVGIFWNYCNGSQGIELIPNVEFWNDLPTLIMEGVSFACSCCGRQSSYGEV